MAIFSKHEILLGDSKLIPQIVKAIEESFIREGYEVMSESLISGGYDISLTKGSVFKAVLGMKTALKVTLMPNSNGISFDANVGIFGQQVIPTVISMFFFWPVIISQIWGLIEQSQIDDKALLICKEIIQNNASCSNILGQESSPTETRFCTECGAKIMSTAKFCPECGTKL